MLDCHFFRHFKYFEKYFDSESYFKMKKLKNIPDIKILTIFTIFFNL